MTSFSYPPNIPLWVGIYSSLKSTSPGPREAFNFYDFLGAMCVKILGYGIQRRVAACSSLRRYLSSVYSGLWVQNGRSTFVPNVGI